MKDYRKPTYPAAINMAKLVYALSREGRYVLLDDIMEELEVSERTLRRYLKTLNENLSFSEQPFIEVYRNEGIERWRLNDQENLSGTHYHLMTLFLGTILMKSLEGTFIQENMGDIFELLQSKLPKSNRKLLINHQKKFYYTAFGAKRYDKHEDALDVLFRSVILQRMITLVYKSHSRQRNEQLTLKPFSLIFHNNALYLIGECAKNLSTRILSVDRIQECDITEDSFEYPEEFDPGKVFSKSFGVYLGEDEAFEVEIEFEEELYDFVVNRRWISNQKTTRVKDGKFRMTAKVTSLFEIGHWVLSMGSGARVIRPYALIEVITKDLKDLCRMYGINIQK